MAPPRIICYGPQGSIEAPSWLEVETCVRSLALYPPASESVAIHRSEDFLNIIRYADGSYLVSTGISDRRAFAATGDVWCETEDGEVAFRFQRPALAGAVQAAKAFFEQGSVTPDLVWFSPL